ncbi:hydrogenase maturation protease [Desulfohalobiaceae bacterium Ax17]|uniref:hydrogenase maturation protease n=1 Tax=Desulfovulcanus ferrireducens TaxID=2831190 RepID=UPI00207BBBE3|nr:hydrogenase maturation protease [Desulfovulcanus ferrireducens]MBT8762638.1 hydrogenase maturation protease [Desulfovulcanus ferrireducens]
MDWSQMFNSRVVVFGCGNTLFGDDGLGPAVIEALKLEKDLPGDIALLDVGTSIRPLLFDLILSDKHPQMVIIVDATTQSGRKPGEVFEIDVDEVDPKKLADFSMHQFPTTNLLKELKEATDMDLRIIVAQTAYVPEQMDEKLSPEIKAAVPQIVQKIKQLIKET